MASIDPGNVPGGLFWTIPIPSTSVEIHLGAGDASLKVDDLATKDFGNIANDLLHGASVPATASFDVQWSGKGSQSQLRDPAQGFRGEFVETLQATIAWSAQESGFTFVSDPPETAQSVFAELGREHNGVFF